MLCDVYIRHYLLLDICGEVAKESGKEY